MDGQKLCRHEFPPEISEHEKHGQCCTKCEEFYTFEQIDGWDKAMRISAAEIAKWKESCVALADTIMQLQTELKNLDGQCKYWYDMANA